MKKKITDAGLALILMVFILSAAVVLTLNFKPLYYFDVVQQGVPADTGLSYEEITKNYDALIQYNSIFNQQELRFPSLAMSPEGQQHFVEVRNIFVVIQWCLFLSAPLLLLGVIYKLRKRHSKFLLWGAGLTLGLPLLLGGLIALNWEGFFVGFHKLFFRNDYWVFDPVRDPVILILPNAFFLHCALLILGLVFFLSGVTLLLFFALRWRTRHKRALLPEANSAVQSSEVLTILRKSLSLVDARLTDHHDRVTYLVFSMLQHAGKLSSYNQENLFVLAAFHDIGARKVDEIDEMMVTPTEDVMKHSIYGYLFLKNLSPLGDWAEALLYHHMSLEKLQKLNCPYQDYAQLIFLADRMDVAWLDHGGVRYDLLRADNGKTFDLKFVEMFIAADQELGLIEKCKSGAYHAELDSFAANLRYRPEDALGYLRLIVFIIDFVSAQTSVHTANTVLLSEEIARRIGFSGRALDVVTYGAFLHDIGKIAIPSSILESTGKLTGNEWKIMQSHVRITDEILNDVVTDEIRHIAARHHEKLDGSGYPYGLSAKELSLPERVVAVADIFSALIGVRSYKNTLPKEEVVAIFTDMQEKGLLDYGLCSLVLENYDDIVSLTTEQQGSVIADYDKIAAEYQELQKRFGLQ